MNRETINIEPYTITNIKTVSSVKIRIENVQLFKSAVIIIDFYDSNGRMVDNKIIHLSGQEYLDWKDDSYIYDYLCDKFGIKAILPSQEPVFEQPATQ